MMSVGLEEQLERALARAPSVDRWTAVLDVVLRHLGAQTGTIHRLDARDGHLHLLAASAGLPEPVLAASRCIPLGKGIAGEAAQTGKPVSICNLQSDASGVARPGARATGVHGALCVPILDSDRVLGTLGIGALGDRMFTEADAQVLLVAGRALARSIQQAQP